MKWVRLISLCALSVFLTGISGCTSRTEIALFEYELSECPGESFNLPSPVIYQRWELETKEPPWVCPGTNYYLMADEKTRAGGGFGKMEATLFYAKIVHGKSCSILLAFPFDRVANKTPREIFVKYANQAVIALLPSSIKAQLPEKKYEVIGKSEDFNKWCTKTFSRYANQAVIALLLSPN